MMVMVIMVRNLQVNYLKFVKKVLTLETLALTLIYSMMCLQKKWKCIWGHLIIGNRDYYIF